MSALNRLWPETRVLRWLCAVALVLAGAVLTQSAFVASAQESADVLDQTADVVEETAGGGVRTDLTPEEAQAFLERVLPEEVEERELVGAAAAILKGDEVIASYGAGLADKANGVAVDPATTRFRLGSISKTIVAAAIMQLVEQGKLDLDADINTYLDFDATPGSDETVTTHHLLTHTAGYSDVYKLLFLADDAHYLPLEDYVREHVPDVIFEPGTITAYSNYGIALAGYLVEKQSGMPFEDYVEQNIFLPLGMERTSMRQPLTDAAENGDVIGYRTNGSVGPFEFIGAGPAGSISATVLDYARFLAMISNRGELDGARVLSEASVNEMITLSPLDPSGRNGGNGFGLTWFVSEDLPGVRHMTHGGDTVLFHSFAKYFEAGDYGLIVSQNTEHSSLGPEVASQFEALIDLPKAQVLPEQADAAEDQRVAGAYFGARFSGHGILKLSKLLRAGQTIEADPEGGIIVNGRAKFKRVGPLTYQDPENPDRMFTFLTDENGKILRTTGGQQPYPFFERPSVFYPIAGATALLMLIGVLGGVVALFRVRKPGVGSAKPWLGAGAMGLFVLAGVGTIASQLIGMGEDIFTLNPSRDGMLRLGQGLLVFGFVAGALAIWQSAKRWKTEGFGMVSKILLPVVLLGGVSALLLALQWNFLALSLKY
ncbi:MAG: serine hydrolase domain-containing protein [Erythrobacter sp.]|uniref:serine hydrolase domain-containing protein n=1 Tax=Erythrobacter sp. TaxID=1042 RepID=UPI00262A7F31|nr:serine hydrolase domain-containing protein [Erythrobacter sp.]MDJ0978128.1 serine hydrolase domain-containing protein [Erythrobacter sp.]